MSYKIVFIDEEKEQQEWFEEYFDSHKKDETSIISIFPGTSMEDMISTLDEQHPDAIIAFIHWGNEYQQQPNAEQRNLAQWLISQGVDHVIGGHPHVVQPIELVPSPEHPTHHAIVYSLGNYVSNMSIPHGDVGLTVTLTLEKIAGTTRLKDIKHNLVWTERAALSQSGNFRIIPSDTIPTDFTPEARHRMSRAISMEKDFLYKNNKFILKK